MKSCCFQNCGTDHELAAGREPGSLLPDPPRGSASLAGRGSAGGQGRGGRPGGRVGVWQDQPGARHYRCDSPQCDDQTRRDPLEGRGLAGSIRGRAPKTPLAGFRLCAAKCHECAQSGAPRGAPDRRGPDPAQCADQARCARTRGRAVRPGRYRPQARRRFSAPVFGRHAPAHLDCDGARLATRTGDRRRTGDRTGCDRATANPGPDPQPAQIVAVVDDHGHARCQRGGLCV